MIPLPAGVERIESLDTIDILGEPHYRVRWQEPDGGRRVILASVMDGQVRDELTREEAVAMARASFLPEAPVAGVSRLDVGDIGSRHEYRGGALPVWQVRFDHSSGTRIYVAAAAGTVASHRNADWRVFDFLWMLHTLDFQGRDDINNPVLRVLSVLAVTVIVSGFLLWAVTSPRLRRNR